MKKFYLLFPFLILILVSLTNRTFAQTVGPSEPITASNPPPTSASAVGKVICNGTQISLSDLEVVPAGTTYQWYKLDPTATPANTYQLVPGMTGSTYTENNTTTPGYYDYKVVTVNSNGCSSPASNVFKVFVLPPLTISINAPLSAFCADGITTTLLTATVPSPASGYALTYVWTQTIGTTTTTVGGNSNTYPVPAQSTAGTPTYKVSVTYDLNNSCPATASQPITIYALPTQPTISAN